MTGDCSIFNPVLLPYLPIYKTILSGIFSYAYFKRKVFFPPNWTGKISCVLYTGAFYSRANTVLSFSKVNTEVTIGTKTSMSVFRATITSVTQK